MNISNFSLINSSNKYGKILAVVVTFNRKDLLIKCLDSLFSQTISLDGLIIVDNASEDGTSDELFRNNIINTTPPERIQNFWECCASSERTHNIPVLYLRMAQNEGGAGGFHEGVKRAMQEGADWLWLMDDDVEPEKNCLEGLLEFSDISKCIHPRKYFGDGVPHEWEGYISHVTGRRIFQPDISFQKGFLFCTINTGCFEGMLVHRNIVETIGYPDKRFFLGSDDSTFGFLAHFHTPVLYTKNPSIKKKKIYIKENNPISDRSIYYGMRNLFLFHSYMNKKIPQYKIIRSFYILIRFLDFSLNIIQNRPEKLKGYKLLFRGVKDGILGRFGKGI